VQNESRKAEVIAALKSEGKVPRIDILVHGLPDEETAFRIEAAVIDVLELAELTNQVRGWGTVQHGRAPLSELIAAYGAVPVEITDPTILIRINRQYRPAMDPNALYEATRGSWRVGERRERAKLAMAVYEGVVRGVYEIEAWHPAGSTPYATRDVVKLTREGRWEFTGREARQDLQDRYLGRSVAAYLRRGLQSPIVYVKCR
jgi:hypothetical protein